MIALLIPVLRRPHRVAPLLDSITRATPAPHRVVFLCSPGDTAEHDAVRAAGHEPVIIDDPPGPGDYARKINHGYRITDEPLLFLGADDLDFRPGWFEAVKARVDAGFHVVGTNDLGNQSVIDGNHATHSVATRAYLDQYGSLDGPGRVLHEGYPHEYVDNEFVETAKARGVWTPALDAIVEHLHPNWGKAPTDELYDQQEPRMRAGRRLYRNRLQLIRREQRLRVRQPVTIRAETERHGVTVITASLPTRLDLLAESMASVQGQTVPCAHLVGVDAGSGVAQVRNRLVAAADTEWVAFLDDDDILDPTHLETLLAHSADADVVIPHCRFDGPPLPPQFCNRPYDRQALRRHGIFPITVLARRRRVLDVGGFALEGWEDHQLWNRLADARARFVVVPTVTWTYRTSTPDRRTHTLHAAGA